MPQKERLRVFNGELKRTSGGLTRDELVKNKRGKIVSKRKSSQAVGAENNLGSWLRSKGDKFSGKPKGFKAEVPDDRDDEKVGELPAPKPKKKKSRRKPKAPVSSDDDYSSGEEEVLAVVKRRRRKKKAVRIIYEDELLPSSGDEQSGQAYVDVPKQPQLLIL